MNAFDIFNSKNWFSRTDFYEVFFFSFALTNTVFYFCDEKHNNSAQFSKYF